MHDRKGEKYFALTIQQIILVNNMDINPTLQSSKKRRSIRLQGYDYTKSGAYFVSICSKNMDCIFGDISSGIMHLNQIGDMVNQCWHDIPKHFPHVELDSYVIMPNHIHGIIVIENHDNSFGAKDFSPLRKKDTRKVPAGTSKTIGSVVRGFKIGVTKWVRQNTSIRDVWQRNYWEHIIRDEKDMNRIQEYIANNPAQWETDRLYVTEQNILI
jgi:putative transposase